MSDYSIRLGVEVDTKKIDSQINSYKSKKTIELGAKLNTGNIDKELASYKAKSQIEVGVKLNTTGIAKKIGEYKPKTPVTLHAELNTVDIDSAISAYSSKNKKIAVGVQLNTQDIQSAIQSYVSAKKPIIEVDARLNDKAIDTAIQNYKPKQQIKVALALSAADIEAKIGEYEARSPLRVKVKINKTDINQQLRQYDDADAYITVKAKLDNGAISEAIRNYKATTPIKVNLELDPADINNKLDAYRSKSPVEIPAKLKLNAKDIGEQLRKYRLTIPIKIDVTELNTEEIDKRISSYKSKVPIKVGVQLDGNSINEQIKGYKISTPLKVVAELDVNSINSQLKNYKATTPIKAVLDLDTTKINERIKSLSVGESIKANIKIDNQGIVEQIRGYLAKTPIRLNVELDVGSIEEKIRAYKAVAPIRVGLELDGKNINEQINKYSAKTPIQVKAQLDTKSIEEKINSYKTKSLIKVGVKLDTQKINEQIKNAKTRSLLKVGVSLDPQKINEQIRNFRTGTPIRFNVELNAENVQNQINNIRQQIQNLGNIRIDLGGTGTGGGGAGGGRGGGGRGAARQAEEVTRAYRELLDIQNRINSKQKKIAKLDTSENQREILELSNQVGYLDQRWQELQTRFGTQFNAAQVDNLSRKFQTLSEDLNLINRKSADAEANLANSIRSGNFAGYDAEVQRITEKLKALSAETPNVKAAIDRVKQALLDMRNASDDNALIEAEKRYQEALKETNALLAQSQSVERQAFNRDNFSSKKEAAMMRLNGLFENGSQAAKKFGGEAKILKGELNKVGNSSGVDVVNRKISTLEQKIRNSNLATKTLGTTLKDQFAKYASYFSVYTVFMYVTQAMRSMFEQVRAIDEAMTELEKVTDETAASYDRFLTNAASRAKEIGTTIDGIVSSTADFARLGYSFEDAQGLAEVANIYAVVGDEIEGVEGATESLISTMAAFKDEASSISSTDFAMDIIDKFNEVGNNFAISSGGIGEAMERSASSMKAANNTIDETIALITAANTVVQNPEAVGTAFKTISMRIRGAKTEMEALGEDTEGMVESTAKLRKEILALSGVDIMEADGQTFKSTYAILDELSQKWQDLSDIQQATITELIAGKRQGNIISSLMNNFDTARSALETSLKSSGSAMKEHEKWQQHLEASINSLKASWQSLSQSFMSSDFLKWGIKALTGLADGVDGLIKSFGVLGTAVGGISLFRMFKRGFALDADGNQVGAYYGIANSFKGLGENFSVIGSAFKANIKAADTFKGKLQAVKWAGIDAGRNIGAAFKKSGAAFAAMLKDFGTMLFYMNAIKAAQDIASWISNAGNDAETTVEKFGRLSDELSGVESDLNNLESELSNVESQIDALLGKDQLTFADEEELSRLREISSELERQINLTEGLQESLKKSLSITSIGAYKEYASGTSFYGDKSKEEKKEEAASTGSSVGNIVGMAAGLALSFVPVIGKIGAMALMGIGGALGSAGGSAIGGAVSDNSYDKEITVDEMLDRMRLERMKLEKAKKEAYEAYSNSPTNANKEAWDAAVTALDKYNATLSEHISKLSEYYNSIDYNSLNSKKQREEYLEMGDVIDTYNIEMGVKGARSIALDRIFSKELITEEAEELKTAIQIAFDSGKEISFRDFNTDEFASIKNRLDDIGITIEDVIGYFKELEESQAGVFDYDTYDIVSNVATLSDGVTALADAFAEFNEQGAVSAKTLTELNEIFGNSGDAWTNYVDSMSNGISSMEDAREATEQLAEAHLDNLLLKGGLRFGRLNEESGKYEFDEENYKTYLSTISQLENLGIENAKEYIDASQQRAMIEEAAAQKQKDSAQIKALLAKETLDEEEQILLDKLKSRDINYYIQDIEDSYNIPLKNVKLNNGSTVLDNQINLDEYNSIIKDKEEQLDGITNFLTEYEKLSAHAQSAYDDYNNLMGEIDRMGGHIVDGAVVPSINVNIRDIGSKAKNNEKLKNLFADSESYYAIYEEKIELQEEMFEDMINVAKEMDIDLSDIIDIDNFNFDATADNAKDVFEQVYNRIKSELEISIEEYEKLADSLSTEIEAAYENLGLDIDFGRYFDKIIMDGFKTKVDQIGTARSEMLSSGGLSTDSIMAIEEIFDDLNSYNSSKLFENTANGVRLNAEEFRRLNNEFKKTNIDTLENKMSDLGDQYVKTREDLYRLEYGTDAYNAKLRELTDIEEQISANEELISQYRGLFSAFQEWQRAESAGSERGMYETILGGFESIGDEISRGWIDDGTKEFLELLKGEKATIIDGDGNKREIDIATASAQDLKKVWKSLNDTIEHTTYSAKDFFTVDEDGNSTSQGVYNWLDAINQMEEEVFAKDVVKRDDNGVITGFNFQIVGGDKVIAEALGISEELVQIMKRASIDAGFVVTFDGSYEQLDVLREKAKKAAEEMNKILEADGKATIDIDMNVESTEDIQSQLDKIMEVFGNKDGNGELTGAINMDIKGADEAIQIASTLQSMKDKLTRPAYMDIQISQVDEELREPLQNLQDYRTNIEQLNQAKLRGADTTELEKSIKESKDKVIKDLIEIQKNNPKLAGELEIEGLTKEEIEKKVDADEIKIPAIIDIQFEMAESLDILALTALKDNGLISDEEYVKRVQVYLDANVDNEDAKDKTDNATEEVVAEEKTKKSIEIIAKTLGIEDVDGLLSKLKDEDLNDKTIETIAKVVGKTDVEELGEVLNNLNSFDRVIFEVIAKAIGEGDVETLIKEVNRLSPKTVEAIAKALGFDDVESLKKSIKTMDGNTVQAVANALGFDDVESLKQSINTMRGNEVDVRVNTDGQQRKISAFQGWIDGLRGKTIDIVTNIKTISDGGKSKANQRTGANPDGRVATVNGTAHVNGTTGRAFKQGDWGTKNSGTALVGELGREVLVRDGKYYTIGNDGAEFIKYKKGDIIFNHVQSEQLFRNGKVTAGGGRAKSFVNGNAFVGGSYPSSGAAFKGDADDGMLLPESSIKVGYNYNNKDSEKSQEIFDWIEVAIERIEREIDSLDKAANNVYKSWSSRNKALASEIGKIGDEIAIQQKAYDAYMSAADEIGLSSEWIDKIKTGAIDINNITDEVVSEKVKDYQKWYDKALDCKDAIEDLKETESGLYKQRFENVTTQYDGVLGVIEHERNMLEEYISQSETQGWLASYDYYRALSSNEKQNIAQLENQKADMLAELQNAMESGTIAKGSEAWYEMVNAIDEVSFSLAEANTRVMEISQTAQQLKWEQFNLLHDKIATVTEETEFLIELLSSDKLFDDNGKLTDSGMATMGQHGVAYNTHMYQAELAKAEADRLKAEMESGLYGGTDKYDVELEERYREMIALQREHILAAQDEKEAIREMVEDGIEFELDALQERIDKYNEALESQKDLYDYQKRVKKQTEEIASLEKQMAAYSGDNSDEAKQKVQQIKVSLESAREELRETEYDKYISDQQKMLDELYLGYEETLNTRIDNLDALVSDMITQINTDATSINATLSEKADSVGYTLSNSMSSIWDTNSTKINDVITTYGDKFSTAQTTTNNALNTINTNLQNMITQLNTIAKTNVKSASTSSIVDSAQANAAKEEQPKDTQKETPKTTTSATPTIKVGGKINAGRAKIYDYAGDTSGEGQYFRNDPIYTVLDEKNGYLKVRHHKLSSGVTGWFKKSDVKALATGAKLIDESQLAWTQEKGQEFIIRPSDGAILTPVAKGDSVLNAVASNNIWDMANSPADFIKDNLNIGAANVPNNSTVQNSYIQNFENVTFSMPNVHGYNELLAEMQRDKNFEKLILSMSIDRIAGKSGLAKGKSIR